MRDLRTFTYLFRLSVKAFGLFVTYVTMCLNLFWIRLKLFFITCSQIILDARQLIRLKNLETRTGLLHHPAFLPVKSNDKSKISPLVNKRCSVFSVSMDGDLRFVFVFEDFDFRSSLFRIWWLCFVWVYFFRMIKS